MKKEIKGIGFRKKNTKLSLSAGNVMIRKTQRHLQINCQNLLQGAGCKVKFICILHISKNQKIAVFKRYHLKQQQKDKDSWKKSNKSVTLSYNKKTSCDTSSCHYYSRHSNPFYPCCLLITYSWFCLFSFLVADFLFVEQIFYLMYHYISFKFVEGFFFMIKIDIASLLNLY